MLWSRNLTKAPIKIETTTCKYLILPLATTRFSSKLKLNSDLRYRYGYDFNRIEKSISNCSRLLLNAGADPMPDGSLGELVQNALILAFCEFNQGSKESLALILNLGGEFVNYKGKDEYGQTMLPCSSQGFWDGLNPHCIKILLDRGASVMARNKLGETYLHLPFDRFAFQRAV